MMWLQRLRQQHRGDLSAACFTVLRVIAVLISIASTASAQGTSRFKNWTAFEASADFKTYQQELSTGAGFTDRHRQLLVQDALPQLLEDANREKLNQIRSQIPIQLLSKISNPTAYGEATEAAVEALDALARGEKGTIAGSINACLLLGELRTKDGQLLTSATPVLSELTLDEEVLPAVRVAALAGLRNRIEAAGGGSSSETKASAIKLLPTFEKILRLDEQKAQVAADATTDWLRQRTLDLAVSIIPLVESDPKLLNDMTDVSFGLLKNADLPVNLRVRAAAVLSRTLKSDQGQLAAETSPLITAIAIAAVAEDRKSLQLIELEQSLSGLNLQSGGGMMEAPMMEGAIMLGPNGEPMATKPSLLSKAQCLQTSWRLTILADALSTIATTLGEVGKPYEAAAGRLRELGIEIYKSPSDETVLAAADTLDPLPEPVAKEKGTEKPTPQPGVNPQPGPVPNTPFSPFQLRGSSGR